MAIGPIVHRAGEDLRAEHGRRREPGPDAEWREAGLRRQDRRERQRQGDDGGRRRWVNDPDDPDHAGMLRGGHGLPASGTIGAT
jgi:hypothetical protein